MSRVDFGVDEREYSSRTSVSAGGVTSTELPVGERSAVLLSVGSTARTGTDRSGTPEVAVDGCRLLRTAFPSVLVDVVLRALSVQWPIPDLSVAGEVGRQTGGK